MPLDPTFLGPPPALDLLPGHGGHAPRPKGNGHHPGEGGEGAAHSHPGDHHNKL